MTSKYGRCILIDWNKPLQIKLTKPCEPFQVFFNNMMDWQDVEVTGEKGNLVYIRVCGKQMGIPKQEQVFINRFGGTKVEFEVRNKPAEDKTLTVTAGANECIVGLIPNKPGFNLKGLDAHLNTRQECENIFDPIQKPSHYNEGRKYETIDVIEDWNLGYHLSNALKYLSRYNRKGDGTQDLKKAVWYINRKIKLEEK